MKRLQFFLPLIVIAFLLGGCPYASKVPVADATEKINPALIGDWEKKTSTDEAYTIAKVDDFHYRLTKKAKKGEKAEGSTSYLAFTSTVDGETFLNLNDEADKESFYIYKIAVSPSGTKITMSEVTENIDETFATSAELKAFIIKYKGLSFFYSKTEDVYYKAE